MKLIGMLIAMLIVGYLVMQQMQRASKPPVVSVPGVELPQATKEAMQQAASGAANNPQATVQAVGAAATQALQSGADQTAEKLKAAEAATQK
jgi:type IV secretory pathway TrbF-like protein